MITVEPVETKKQRDEFIKLPWKIYADDPYWVPPFYFERQEFLDPQKNAFFEHAQVQLFIAYRDGKPVGTIAAVENPRHNEFHEEQAAHFGLFETIEDAEVAHALFDTVETWARARGLNKLIGPENLSTNDPTGLKIEGFDTPPMLYMTHNPPYYQTLVENEGFVKAMGTLAWYADREHLLNHVPPKFVRVADIARRRNKVTLRNLNLKDWDGELERIKRIYNGAWEKNWGFVPLTDAELEHIAEGLKLFVDPRVSFMAEIDGEAIGLMIPLPDINELLIKYRPKPNTVSAYFSALRVLTKRRKLTRLRVFMMGVLREYRMRGIDALLMYETLMAAAEVGYLEYEASWILENNDAMNKPVQEMGTRVYQRFNIYEKAL
ncbi:MAG: GNAT family N-acetyltransferase [Anaerolineae bacterium]|nr:GNAT family N-acetyltransferase [Anaerolineae bacterium]